MGISEGTTVSLLLAAAFLRLSKFCDAQVLCMEVATALLQTVETRVGY